MNIIRSKVEKTPDKPLVNNPAGNGAAKIAPSADPSVLDVRVSWQLYKENKRVFIQYAVFCMALAFIVTFVLTLFLMILFVQLYAALGTEFNLAVLTSILSIILIPTMFLYFALIGSFYGLAYDIMSSGDEFTEFRSFVTYFRAYWKQYIACSLLCGAINLLSILFQDTYNANLLNIQLDPASRIGIMILINVLGGIWYCTFVMVFPAVTSHGSIKQAIKENFAIIRENPKRIVKYMLVYFVLCVIPTLIMLIVQTLYLNTVSLGGEILIIISFYFIDLILFAIGTPMLVLITTRIYNTSKIPKKAPQDLRRQVKMERKF